MIVQNTLRHVCSCIVLHCVPMLIISVMGWQTNKKSATEPVIEALQIRLLAHLTLNWSCNLRVQFNVTPETKLPTLSGSTTFFRSNEMLADQFWSLKKYLSSKALVISTSGRNEFPPQGGSTQCHPRDRVDIQRDPEEVQYASWMPSFGGFFGIKQLLWDPWVDAEQTEEIYLIWLWNASAHPRGAESVAGVRSLWITLLGLLQEMDGELHTVCPTLPFKVSYRHEPFKTQLN